MAIDILSLKPTTISRDLKGKFVCIYSLPKVGKTSMAFASSPRIFFLVLNMVGMLLLVQWQ